MKYKSGLFISENESGDILALEHKSTQHSLITLRMIFRFIHSLYKSGLKFTPQADDVAKGRKLMGKTSKNAHPVLIIQHAPHEHAAALFRALNSQGIQTQTIRIFENNTLPAVDKIQGLISLGGPMGANDESLHPWIRSELDLMKRCFERNLPIAGICLGGQMLARALGGRVTQNDHPEIGWFPVSLTEHGKTDPLMSSAGEDPKFYQWHYDTFFLPKEAILLGGSKICERQAYRIGGKAYGFQFHPEADHQLVDEWLSIEGTDEEILLARTAHHQECVHSPDKHREHALDGELSSLSFVAAISQLFQNDPYVEACSSISEPCEEKRTEKKFCTLTFLDPEGNRAGIRGRIDRIITIPSGRFLLFKDENTLVWPIRLDHVVSIE